MASTVTGGGRSERWLAMQADIDNTRDLEGDCTQIVWDQDADAWYECISYPESPEREQKLYQNNDDGPQDQTGDGTEDFDAASSIDSNDMIELIKFVEYQGFGGRGPASEAGFSDDAYVDRGGSASPPPDSNSGEDVDRWLNQQYLGDPKTPEAEMEKLEGLGPCQYCFRCQESLGRAWSQRVKDGRKGKESQEAVARCSDAESEDSHQDKGGSDSEDGEEQIHEWYLVFDE